MDIQERGVTLVSNCEVQEVVSKQGAITGVRTNQGFIECDNFVNTASAWARHVGTLSYPRVGVPMHAVEHYFLRTRAMPQLMPDCPIIRDPDGHVYFREDDGRFLAGGFEPEAKPLDVRRPSEAPHGNYITGTFYGIIVHIISAGHGGV